MHRTAFALFASVSASIACGACSDGGRISLVPATDGGDAALVDASDGASNEATDDASLDAPCGPAPYVSVGIIVRGASIADPKGTPLAGARFTSPLCPRVARVSAMDGTINGLIAKSTPFYGRIDKMAYLPLLTPELRFDADVSGVNVSIPPTIVAQFIPGFGDGKTAIAIGAMKGGGTGACATLDGVSFRVDGHPEAIVTYFSTDTIPQPTGGTETTTSGRAAITGLAASAPVAIIATKSGCTVDMAKPPQTGRAPLEVNYLTVIAAYVGD